MNNPAFPGLPDIVFDNRFYLGDSILLEPIASIFSEVIGKKVYIRSGYSELFDNHPNIIGIDDSGLPDNARIVDMEEAISSTQIKRFMGKIRYVPRPGKILRMYESAGLSASNIQSPQLYLSSDEIKFGNDIKTIIPSPRIGIILESRANLKTWPYTKLLVNQLNRMDYSIFIIGKDNHNNLPGIKIIGQPLRQLMAYISAMDLVIGPDTGTMHLAASLNVDIMVLTRQMWKDIYEIYQNAEIIAAGNSRYSLWTIPVKSVLKRVDSKFEKPIHKKLVPKINKRSVALFRLDGLGGTVTLSDHAKKIYELTGMKSVPIVRSYAELFSKNPYVDSVETVGYVRWDECLQEMLAKYDCLAEIRFAIGKWHQKDIIFHQDFSDLQGIFDKFPKDYRDLEQYQMHHVQLTDKILGLSYDTIDSQIYDYDKFQGLPSKYIVINNGVDAQHRGMKQTKTWDYWNTLVELLEDIEIIQVGTKYDDLIEGAIDLRNKTTLPQLFSIIKDSSLVICGEGGLMHLAFATNAPNTLVLRGPTTGKLFEYPGHKFIDTYVCGGCWSRTDDWYNRCSKYINKACMNTITPQRVAYQARRILDEVMA
jgi:ADP-heptose:LPS heptosyltransferase